MKNESQCALEVSVEHLDKIIKEIKNELYHIDPSASCELRVYVAKIEGLLNFMKGQV